MELRAAESRSLIGRRTVEVNAGAGARARGHVPLFSAPLFHFPKPPFFFFPLLFPIFFFFFFFLLFCIKKKEEKKKQRAPLRLVAAGRAQSEVWGWDCVLSVGLSLQAALEQIVDTQQNESRRL